MVTSLYALPSVEPHIFIPENGLGAKSNPFT